MSAPDRGWVIHEPDPLIITAGKRCIAEGHWTSIFDDETRTVEIVHDPDEGPCEFPPDEITLLREALDACIANIEENGAWGIDALTKTRAALDARRRDGIDP